MNLYPATLQFPNKADHLLFDVGFTMAMLATAGTYMKNALDQLPDGELRHSMVQWLAQYQSFANGRLQLRDEVYAAGEAAAKKIWPNQ